MAMFVKIYFISTCFLCFFLFLITTFYQKNVDFIHISDANTAKE